jgi:4-cresol dehydrogenase (hydroxylating)
MHLMLMRKPEECLRCVLLFDDDHLIAPYIESMRMLKEEGVFDGLPHIGNDVRALSMCTRFDFEHWDPAKGISEETLRKLRNQYRVTRWTLACGIYGSRTIARAKARRAVQVLKRIGRVKILSERTMHWAKSCARIVGGRLGNIVGPKLSEYARHMEQQIDLLALLDGYPTDLALKGCYWRNRSRSWRPGTDPIKDGCGFRWLAPSLPMKGDVVLEMLRLAQQCYREKGFEFAATLTAVNAKMCQAILSIYFDFDNVRESERAKQLACELKQRFDSRGWCAYRIANDEISSEMANAHPELVSLRSRIKHAFDPNGILSPGRYA